MTALYRLAAVALTIMLLPLTAPAQKTKSESDAEASALQAARAKSVLRKGGEVLSLIHI